MPKIIYVDLAASTKKASKSSIYTPYIEAVANAPKGQGVLVPERLVGKEEEALFRTVIHKAGLSAKKGSHKTSPDSRREIRGYVLSPKKAKRPRPMETPTAMEPAEMEPAMESQETVEVS